ncbi:uncharacterized protein YALI1_C03261g [Yarrowia lipolytica]|uniref:Uncharacterized protein n=1 Tax=Yarrowia lipolytica TaxID=4952 RepID=A0A1D8N9B6_YARLL|nr:hypothetical protein YALI1_C03261g [Yarrowia lipolytica]
MMTICVMVHLQRCDITSNDLLQQMVCFLLLAVRVGHFRRSSRDISTVAMFYRSQSRPTTRSKLLLILLLVLLILIHLFICIL